MLGAPLQNGMLTAERHINESLAASKSPQVELFIEDSKNTVNGTLAAYSKMRALGVDAIVSTGDTELRALNGVVDQNPIPIIATSCVGGLDQRSPWIFRYCYSEQSQMRDLSEFIVNNLMMKRMTLIYANNAYGPDVLRHTKDQFAKVGGHLQSAHPFLPDSADQKSVVAKALEDKPELLCIRGIGPGFEAIIRTVREMGFKGRIVGDITLALPDTLKNVGDALEGTYYVASELDTSSSKPSIVSYTSLYRKHFSAEPSFWDALGFDSVSNSSPYRFCNPARTPVRASF